MVACTLLFEGSAEEVAAEERALYRLAARHGGMKAGAENGERGYQLTFAIAYIRDFMMRHWVIAESFETSVPWSEAQAVCDNVKQRVFQEHAKRGLPGRPFISVRVTQLYPTGVCLYFYLAFHYKGVERPSEVFAEIERAARDEILSSGGSLSHHHGIGKLRAPFLSRIYSPAALEWRKRLKRAVDPDDVLGCGNG
jgi:alkyldihydroxyacetonephosphate synthase